MVEERGQRGDPDREKDLIRIRGWFAPALQADEVLRAALAATPYRLTLLNSLVATARELAGRNQGRVLLLTDRAVRVAGRRFWRRRFRVLLATFPIGSTRIQQDDGVLWIDSEPFYLNWSGFQMGGVVGSMQDVELFVGAGIR